MLLDPIHSRRLFQHALENGYAILAINADSHAAVTDCLEAARQADSPVIIETSLWQLTGRGFGNGDAILGLGRYLADLALLANADPYRNIPVVFHTDHIKGPRTEDILAAGIRGIAFQDGKLHPSTLSLDASEFTVEQNIETICRLADIAREAGKPITLEMESEVDEGITPPEITRHLVGAVEERHPDTVYLYAPGLGTKHGFHEGYPDFNADVVGRNVDLLETITGRRFGLALHGSTGLSEDDLTAAAQRGVVKVNWSSESLDVRSTAARDFYERNRHKLDRQHPEWKLTAMDNGVQQFVSERYIPVVRRRFEVLGSQGKASTFIQQNARVTPLHP